MSFDERTLYSDLTEDYIIPAQPKEFEPVTIRIRTKKETVEKTYICMDGKKNRMYIAERSDLFDYYQYAFLLENHSIRYYFEVHTENGIYFYDQRGSSRDVQEYYFFKIIPGFEVPKWARGAVMYQLYVDRFFNGDPTNDVLTNEYQYIGEFATQVTDWNKIPAIMGVREFYGGDLQGVWEKLDYLQELGIEVIYFNPLFVSPSNHKYDIQDYDHIDPHIGRIVFDEGNLLNDEVKENRFATKYINRVTAKENLEASDMFFVKLVEEIHKRGMKVILDGVFNHCGSFNRWMDRERIYEMQKGYEKGAYISENSPYKDYFAFSSPNWPYNGSYDGWWGFDTLPKLNYEGSEDLYREILRIAEKWVSKPYYVDGWRLDVAADLGHSSEANHKFWTDFRRVVKHANPNAIIIAEHYGDPSAWLDGKQWDTVMNYDAFMEPITWFLTGMQKHSDDFREDLLGNADAFLGAMRHHMAHFTGPSLDVAMNELSNHDHSRFLTRTNRKVGRVDMLGAKAASEGIDVAVMRLAVLMQMTWIGAPTIYYGDEVGLCGFTDPDNRRSYPWGKEDNSLFVFHKEMITIRKKYPVLRTGSLRYIEGDFNYLAYTRFNQEEVFIIAVNNNRKAYQIDMEVAFLGVQDHLKMQKIISCHQNGYDTSAVEYNIHEGRLRMELPAQSAVLLRTNIAKENNRKNFLQFV